MSSDAKSTEPRSQKQQPQRPRTAAQRASDANRLQQAAVRANTARPSDRRAAPAESPSERRDGKNRH